MALKGLRNVNLPAALDAAVVMKDLARAFDEDDQTALAQAYLRLADFYGLTFPPSVTLANKVKRGNPHWAGFCSERGSITLTQPARWKRNRRHNSRERWIEVALHEFGHFLFYSFPEEKADWFAAAVLERSEVNGASVLTAQAAIRRKGHKQQN